MNELQARKQLLITESELNRVHLRQEWGTLAAGVHSIADRTRSFNAIAASAAALVAGLVAFRRARVARTEAKPSLLQIILKSASLASTLWLAFRSPRRDSD